jgi:hypothetical protein
MRSSAAKRKRVGRPRAPQRRPVLAARVPEEFYARILASAAASGRNASEELMWRAQQSYEWETAFKSSRDVLADAKKAAAETMTAALKRKLREEGYTRVNSMTGAMWLEPGVSAVQFFNDDTRALIRELMELAAERAIQKLTGGG